MFKYIASGLLLTTSLIACGAAGDSTGESAGEEGEEEVGTSEEAVTPGWHHVCSPDGTAGLYNGAMGWQCPGGFLKNFGNGHRVYVHQKNWCPNQGRYYSVVTDNYLNAGLIKSSLLCNGW